MTHKSTFWLMVISVFGLAIAGSEISAQDDVAAATADTPELRVYPAHINITHARDLQSLVVQAVMPDGVTRDVTGEATKSLADTSIAKLENNVLFPVADGETKIDITVGELSAEIPVTVSSSTTLHPVSFQLDVMPIFMKAGCNAGSCHGAARGTGSLVPGLRLRQPRQRDRDLQTTCVVPIGRTRQRGWGPRANPAGQRKRSRGSFIRCE